MICWICKVQKLGSIYQEKLLNHNHFTKLVKQRFTYLHSKYVVQCVGGDALTIRIAFGI
jgi:hypothetical protein